MPLSPPTDPVQTWLHDYHARGDQRALRRAFDALRREWANTVACYERCGREDPRTEEALGELLSVLLLPREDRPPRALAPSEHPSPAGWRKTVLLNALRDRKRRQQAYRHALEAVHGAAQDGPKLASAVPAPSAEEAQIEQLDLLRMRRRVVVLLPRMEIRRRVVLALELGMDLAHRWVTELAAAQGEPEVTVRERVTACTPPPAEEMAKVRVLYKQAAAQAREAYRKTLERARKEVADLLQQEVH